MIGAKLSDQRNSRNAGRVPALTEEVDDDDVPELVERKPSADCEI